jgi:copper chaperone CopZ
MIHLNVTGMRCGGCQGRVSRLIAEHLPDALIEIDLPSGSVRVDHPQAETAALIHLITEAGFGAAAV